MDPSATLERIRIGYATNNYAEITEASADLLGWLHRGGFGPVVAESQLSALLIMATGYARAELVEQAPNY